MINNVSVIEHDKLILYSLDDFAMDEDLQECIRNAKVEAISLKNASCQVKEIGNGSANNTSVFCIPNPDISGEKLALKLVSYITTTYPPEYEADEAVRDLVNNTPKSNRVIDEIINSLKTKDCRNVIPLSGHDTIIWKCPKYNRIGIDYALKMPLAACINDTISKYVVRHNTGTNALLTEEKPETEKTILEIGIDLCIALQDLHAHGIIHRDIKPGNIFLYKEHYCLGDFGIAVENPSSQDFRVGTQDYWAPEQAGDMFSDKYDHRMDIYSLGLVLYELADTMSVSMHYRDRMKGQSLPDLSSVSKGLNKILHKACQFDPDNRYQNAESFWADLHLLQNKHDYIPVYQAPEESHEYATSKNKSAGTPSNTAYSSSQKRNPYGRKQARKKLEDFIISPETVWNAGKFWYDESCKRGNRFSGFDIDRRIMPLSVTSNHVIDLPVNVVTDQETVKNQKPLSEIISNIEKLHNMYLIGEGGIGKTTALYSIMKDAYREKLPSKSENEKQIIPLFIELSKAPAEYCSVYESSHSTFIRRYLFMLINSFHSQHLISESAVEMTRIMQMDMIFSVQKIDALLRKSPNNVQYLLLLDGLNEVARKQLSIPGNDYMGSPLEFIVSEIHELLKHSNVSVIITSRADETLGDSKNIFDRLYLTGVSKRAIKKYLTQHEISYKRVKENKRLIETLRIPLFLKLYSQLYSTSEVSTPGEILYAFFSERSAKYTIRNRISEIKADHRMSGENPASNRIDEKLQWFILDFLLPELGWYMEKKDLYTVNLETIKQVVDSVLKGTSETDICGKYGKAMFCDYHNGKDGSVNTRTYADQLLHLNLSRQSYIQTIVDYCVYSFGILYVNNQNYGFIHQHIRDFFAALKIITDIKFANSILHTDKITAIHRLSELNNNMLSASVSQFLSDLSIPLSSKSKSDFYSNALNIYRNVFDTSSGIGVKNIIEILYKVKGNLADMNFSNLDLRKCQLYGINLERSSFAEAKLSKNTLFFKGHNSSIRNAGFSPDGKHIFSIEYDDTLRTWNTHALAEENIFSREAIMRPMAAKYSVSGKLFFVIYFIEGVTRNYTIYVYDSGSMKCIKQKKILYTTHNSEVGMSVEKGEHFNFVEISPDDKYLIIGDIFNTILLDPIQKDENNKRYIHSFRTNLNQALRILVYSLKKQFLSTVSLDLSPQILADPLKQYIVAAFPYNDNIVFYSADTLEEEFKISLPEKKYFSKRLCICPSGRFLAVFMDFNIYILDIQKRMIFRTRTWDRKTGKLNPTSCKFINFNSETCMLLKYETGRNGANPYYFSDDKEQNIIVWSFTQNTDVFQMKDTIYSKICDCLENSILFDSSSGFQLTDKLNENSGAFLFNKEQYGISNIRKARYSSNKAYLIIYSRAYIQIWNSTNLYLMHELHFDEAIQSVLCTSQKLYIAFLNGYFRVFELNSWKLLYENTNLRKQRFFISPKQKFLIAQNYTGDFELYDIHSFEYIRSFNGDFFAFNDSETRIIIGHNYTKFREERITDHTILTEWTLDITTVSDKYIYTFEIVNIITEDIIIEMLRDKGFIVENVTYFFVVDLRYLPDSNKLIIYFKLTYSRRSIFTLWNMDTKKCEKLILSDGSYVFSETDKKFYTFIEKEANTSMTLIDLHNLKQIKIKNLKPTYNIEDVKDVQKNLLRKNKTSITVYNIQTKKYITIPFFPNLYVKDAIFTATSASHDFDEFSLKVLEMYGSKLE